MAAPFLIAAAGVQAVGSIISGNANAASYKAAAAGHDYNADRLDENAQIAYQQAGAREDASRRRSNAVLGQQRAAIAQSGVETTTGSAALVQEQSADTANLDALMIRYQGNLEARGYHNQADQERYAGRVSRMNATSARRAGSVSAVSSLLSGGSKAYGGGGSIAPPSGYMSGLPGDI